MALASQQTHKLLENVALPYKSFTSPIDSSPQFVGGRNVLASLKGICVQRPGFSDALEPTPTVFHNVQRIYQWTRWDGTTEIVMVVDMLAGIPTVYKFVIGTDASFGVVRIAASTSDPFDFVAENNVVYFSNNLEAWKWSPTIGLEKWGIVAPAAPSIGLTAGVLSTFAGGYYYVTTYQNSVTGHESSPSPLSVCTGNFAAMNVTVTFAASSDAQVDKVNIYRTPDGGANTPRKMAFVAQVADTASPYTDTTPDGSLSATRQAPAFYQNDPPPPLQGIQSYAGRIWGYQASKVWYSGQEEISNGVPQECFPGASVASLSGNFYAYARSIQAIAPLTDGIAPLSPNPIYKIEGDSRDTFRRYTLLAKRGTVNRQTVKAVGSSVTWLDVSSQLWLSDSGEISRTIRPDVEAIPQGSATVEIHISGEEHWICLLDASTGMLYVYDIDLSQWNVPWKIEGGASTIASIETAPGTIKLAAAIGGTKICVLNPAKFVDNGAEYDAWAATSLIPVAPESNPEFLGQLNWVSVETNQYQPTAVGIVTDDDPVQVIAATNPFSQQFGSFKQLTQGDPQSRRYQGVYLTEMQYKAVPDPAAPPCRRVSVRLDWQAAASPALWSWYSLDAALTPFGK